MVEDHGILHVVPPSWRHDVDGPADLVEEVVRIHGLADVPSVPLARTSAVAAPVLSKAQRRTRTARRALAARGFNETVSFSFIARGQAALFGGGDEARQLSNPIASDLDALRPSLLPSLAGGGGAQCGARLCQSATVRDRRRLRQRHAGSAENCRRRHPHRQSRTPLAEGRRSRRACSRRRPTCWRRWKPSPARPCRRPVTQGAPGWYHPGRSGTIAMGPKVIAQFGELHPKVLAAFDLKVPAAGFEIFLDAIPDAKTKGKAKPLFAPSPFQAIERDFAFVVDAKVAAGEIVKARQAGRPRPDRHA